MKIEERLVRELFIKMWADIREANKELGASRASCRREPLPLLGLKGQRGDDY